MNLQFSCSFFLQGEGISNGRPCASGLGAWDMPEDCGDVPDSALCEATAGEISRANAAQQVVFGITNSELVAAVSAMSSDAP